MGARRRLPDGGAELRRRALAARQADGPRPAAPPPRQITENRIRSKFRQCLTAAGLFRAHNGQDKFPNLWIRHCQNSAAIVAEYNPTMQGQTMPLYKVFDISPSVHHKRRDDAVLPVRP